MKGAGVRQMGVGEGAGAFLHWETQFFILWLQVNVLGSN